MLRMNDKFRKGNARQSKSRPVERKARRHRPRKMVRVRSFSGATDLCFDTVKDAQDYIRRVTGDRYCRLYGIVDKPYPVYGYYVTRTES